jgi:hypothetical protein
MAAGLEAFAKTVDRKDLNLRRMQIRKVQAQMHNEHPSTTAKYYLAHDAKHGEEKLAQIMETLGENKRINRYSWSSRRLRCRY